ncbi:MAG: exodeoxyribonuclease VII large subunit [Cardiobacteriaceae bacterium]|nr:exodeoxyribonuclease VII large subunit [Cardiobacteriaceae bacterium]
MTTYTVSQLNVHVRNLLEGDFRDIWVEGEISNLSRPASGHLYFSLKDDGAQVACALFKGNTYRLQLPQKELANGIAVRVHGRATLYEPRGNYQLVLDQIEAAGIGALEAELKRRQALLAAEGCFAVEYKHPIPLAPQQIGIITSPSGAAIHDALTTLRRRNPLVSIIIYPSMVQGEQAPAQLIQQIQTANRRNECDTLLLIRGGGSLEDLWAFNDPQLIRAIAASNIPIISGIGHETDVTLADLAADLRAPTPTAAAEQSCPDLSGRQLQLDRLHERLTNITTRHVRQQQQQLSRAHDRLTRATTRYLQQQQLQQQHLTHRLTQQNPLRQIRTAQQRADQLEERLRHAITRSWQQQRQHLHTLMQNLHHLSPLNILQRGYALPFDANGKIIRQSDAVQTGEKISIRLAAGRLYCTVNRRSKISP